MKVKVLNISPRMAKGILAVQEKRIADGKYRQRNLDERTIVKYAQDMRAGHWVFNNQGIGFDDKGNLIDGRHRLWAIVRSGVTVKMAMFTGLQDIQNETLTIKAVDTIDCGRQRSVSMQLTIDGVKGASMVAAAVRAIVIATVKTPNRRLSLSMVKGIMQIYGDDIQKVWLGLHTDPRLMRGGFVGPLAVYNAAHPNKARAFLKDFYDMTELKEGSPIIALRRYWQNHGSRGHDQVWSFIQVVCNAIMTYHEDDTIAHIRTSEEAVKWLLSLDKARIERVARIVGGDQPLRKITDEPPVVEPVKKENNK